LKEINKRKQVEQNLTTNSCVWAVREANS